MRKLPTVKYISQQVADQIDCDGVFDTKKRTIKIRHGMDKLYELKVYLHEQLHFIQEHYKGYIVKMNDKKDLKNNETDKAAKKILKLILQDRYKKVIKDL
jgi:hypothetical protein